MKPTKTQKRLLELTAEVSKKLQFPYDLNFIAGLRRDAITLRRLFEFECNGCTREKLAFESWADYDKARESQLEWVEKRVAAVQGRIEKRCKKYNIPFYIQSDPRGCSLYLGTTSENSYNTEGVAVY